MGTWRKLSASRYGLSPAMTTERQGMWMPIASVPDANTTCTCAYVRACMWGADAVHRMRIQHGQGAGALFVGHASLHASSTMP